MDKQIELVVADIKRLIEAGHIAGNATYSYLSNGNVEAEEVVSCYHRICFGALLGTEAEVVATALIKSQDRPSIDDELCKVYFYWLFNDSPYAKVFISKDPEEVLKQGYILVSGKHPANLVLGGLQATRRRHEYTSVSTITSKLIMRGFNGNLAYAIAHQINITTLKRSSGGTVDNTLKARSRSVLIVDCWNSWHNLSDHASLDHMTDKEIVNFCKSQPALTMGNFCNKTSSACHVKRSWISPKELGAGDRRVLTECGIELTNSIDNLFTTTEGASLNPFKASAPTKARVLKVDKFIEGVVSIKDDLYKITKLEK